jgi:hypothetical protein
MAGHVHLIWVRREWKYFCKRGWTGFGDLPVRQKQQEWVTTAVITRESG